MRATILAFLAVIGVAAASGCERSKPPPPPAPAAEHDAGPAPTLDPRVSCPPGTQQQVEVLELGHHLHVWCEDEEGYRQGPDKTWYRDGTLMQEENLKRGRLDGITRFYFRNGKLSSESPYRDGKIRGLTKTWHENGALAAEIEFSDDEPVGVGRWWDERGRLIRTERYGNAVPKRGAAPAAAPSSGTSSAGPGTR